MPGCWYPEGDLGCIKDGIATYYDSTGVVETSHVEAVSCWRAMEGGRRYLPWQWPAGNVDAQIDGTEPCLDWR